MKVLQHLKHLKADIALLQETHLPAEYFHCMQKLQIGRIWELASVNGKAGFFILLNKHLVCDLISDEHDNAGCIATIHLHFPTQEDHLITNIYAPKSLSKHFFHMVCTCLIHTPNLAR